MKLSIEVAGYNDAHDFNGDTHLISSRRLDKWAKSISELEAQLAECQRGRDALREDITELQDRLNHGIQYNSERNEYVLVWTEREIDQARIKADEICKILGIAEGNN